METFSVRFYIGLALAYLVLVRVLRYRRRARLERHREPSRGSMTFATAQHIVKELAELEFPFTFEKALQFALFRTYGIPSISHTLVQTRLLARPESAAKRYVDTAVLITEFISRDWGSREWVEAVARMNCLHAAYQGRGVTDVDLLYTLALFALEPIRWIERWEWRLLTSGEKLAIGVFWKGIGDAMNIPYARLPGNEGGKGWRDGVHWLEELEAWADAYEARCMVPEETNHQTAEHTTAILVWDVPTPLKPLGKQAVCTLMDDRLREAMMYERPPAWMVRVVHGLLYFRRSILMHLTPPRPSFLAVRQTSQYKSPHGTFYMEYYTSQPYYVRPTIANRWGLGAWLRRLQGLSLPGDDGDKFQPQGFKTVDIGPGIGKTGQRAMEEKVAVVGRMSHPMACGQKH